MFCMRPERIFCAVIVMTKEIIKAIVRSQTYHRFLKTADVKDLE